MTERGIITAVAMLAALSLPLLADEVCPEIDQSLSGRFGQLERDIPSLYLINGLNLSPEQAGKIADFQEKVRKIEEKYDGRLQKFAERRKADFEKEIAYIVAMSASHGKVDQEKLNKSARTERLKLTRQEINKILGEKSQELDELADRAFASLTDSQKAVIGNFTPCFIPPADFKNPERVGQAAADTTVVESILTGLKTAIDGKKTAEARQKALDRLTIYALEKRYIKFSEEAESEVRSEIGGRMELIIDKIKNMSAADFELEKKNLAVKLVPLPSKTNTAESARWMVLYYVLNPGVTDVMKSRAAPGDKAAGTGSDYALRLRPEIVDREKALLAAGVINSLELTKDQSSRIVPIIKDALKTEKDVGIEIGDAMKLALEPYQNLRAKLKEGQTTPQVETAASHAHGKVRNMRETTLVEKLTACEKEMDRILTAKQIDFLSTDIKEIRALIGKGRDELVNKSLDDAKSMLSDARRLAAQTYNREKDQICRKFVEECIKTQCLDKDAIDTDSEVKRLAAILDDARKLDETTYSNKRENLAAELCPRRTKIRPPSYGNHYAHGGPVQTLNPTTRLIFSEPALQILQKMAAN